MATVRYIGPSVVVDDPVLGPVEHGRVKVPVLDREMDPGEVVEVPDELLEEYAWPPTLWEVTASSDDPRTVKDLRAAAADRGLPTSGTKADLIERLAQPTTTEDGE